MISLQGQALGEAALGEWRHRPSTGSERTLAGDVSWQWGAAAAFARVRALNGVATWHAAPSAAFLRERTIEGAAPWEWSPTSEFVRPDGARTLVGAVSWEWASASPVLRERAVVGDLSWGWDPVADFEPERKHRGAVPWSWGPSAPLVRERSIGGAAPWLWSVAATLDRSGAGELAELVGAVAWTWGIAGAFQRLSPSAPPSPLLAQIAADFAAIMGSPDWLSAALEDSVMGFARTITAPSGTITGLWQGARVAGGEWRAPFVLVADADGDLLSPGDLLEIDGVSYRVAGAPMRTGLGTSRVVLDLGAVP